MLCRENGSRLDRSGRLVEDRFVISARHIEQKKYAAHEEN